MKIRNTHEKENVELMMTPMIDIVFQLLAFFIITFKVTAMEGDFQITMPLASESQTVNLEQEVPTVITVTLYPNSDGSLDEIVVNDTNRFGNDYAALSEFVRDFINDPNAGSLEDDTKVEFICLKGIKYGEFVNAMTAVTGYRSDGEIIPLVENIEIKDQE